MKRLTTPLATLALTLGLAACGQPSGETTAAPEPAAEAKATDMGEMKMAPAAGTAKGAGTVTAVSADSVTIDHAPIPEANWPAMVMSFEAPPEIASSVKPGDKVAFDLKLEGGGGRITALQKQ